MFNRASPVKTIIVRSQEKGQAQWSVLMMPTLGDWEDCTAFQAALAAQQAQAGLRRRKVKKEKKEEKEEEEETWWGKGYGFENEYHDASLPPCPSIKEDGGLSCLKLKQ